MKTLSKVQKLIDLIKKLKLENEELKAINKKQSDLIKEIQKETDKALA